MNIYFHGDNGAGLGASHQTGWSGIVGNLMQVFGALSAKDLLEEGRIGAGKRIADLVRGRAKASPRANP